MRARAFFVTGRLPLLPDILPAALGLSNFKGNPVDYVRRSSCGLAWQFAQLSSVEAVKKVVINYETFVNWSSTLRDAVSEEERRDRWFAGIVVFAVDTSNEGETQIYARVLFQEGAGLVEDPATGSAALA